MANTNSSIAQGAVTSAKLASNISNPYPYGNVATWGRGAGYNTQSTSGTDAFIKAQTAVLLNSLKQNQEVYAPALNLSAISAQARKSAAGAVNPFYTKALGDFVKQQSYEKGQQQAQTKTSLQNIQDTLANTLAQNQTSQQRTGQDVAQNITDINTQANQYQTDTGSAFDEARIALAKSQALSGTAGGAAQGAQLQSQQANATAESRQGAQFQQQEQQQNLYRARTFADLARSGEQAKTTAAKGKAQAQFDLNQFIKEQGFALGSKKTDLEIARQNALEASAQKYGTKAVNAFIQSIANPGARQAARQAYGGLSF